MAAREDLARIAGLATLMAGLLSLRNRTNFTIVEVENFTVDVTAEMKQELLNRYNTYKSELKSLANGL